MKNTIQTTPQRTPFEITIAGTPLVISEWSAKTTDPEPEALFPDRPAREGRYYETDESQNETEITMTFKGEDALRARQILAALLSETCSECDRRASYINPSNAKKLCHTCYCAPGETRMGWMQI